MKTVVQLQRWHTGLHTVKHPGGPAPLSSAIMVYALLVSLLVSLDALPMIHT